MVWTDQVRTFRRGPRNPFVVDEFRLLELLVRTTGRVSRHDIETSGGPPDVETIRSTRSYITQKENR